METTIEGSAYIFFCMLRLTVPYHGLETYLRQVFIPPRKNYFVIAFIQKSGKIPIKIIINFKFKELLQLYDLKRPIVFNRIMFYDEIFLDILNFLILKFLSSSTSHLGMGLMTSHFFCN